MATKENDAQCIFLENSLCFPTNSNREMRCIEYIKLVTITRSEVRKKTIKKLTFIIDSISTPSYYYVKTDCARRILLFIDRHYRQY